MRIETWSLQHSNAGWKLVLRRESLWRRFAGDVVEAGLARVGHPCCFQGVGRFTPVGHVAFRVLQWTGRYPWATAETVAERALSRDEANELAPEFVARVEEYDEDDEFDDLPVGNPDDDEVEYPSREAVIEDALRRTDPRFKVPMAWPGEGYDPLR